MQSVSIPGKLMLSGEFAVLNGAKSALVPVKKFLKLTAVDHDPRLEYSPVVSEALTIPIERLSEQEKVLRAWSLEIDPSEFYSQDALGKTAKLGLGSSAAEAVGVIALRYERLGLPWFKYATEIAGIAMRAHSDAQGRIGSGADIACCAYRQPLIFSRQGDQFSVEPINRPEGDWLPLNLVWTGHPADTRRAVKQYMGWLNNHPEDSIELLSELIESADELASAWFKASEGEFFGLLDSFDSLIKEIAAKSSVTYELPVHARLSAWAKRHGGRAKPTGAGGGDMALLIGDLPISQLGAYTIIPLSPDEMW